MVSRKKRRKVMRLIIKNKFDNKMEKTSLYYICNHCKMKHEEVLKIITILTSQGYLIYQPKTTCTNEKNSQDFAILTKKGISYFENDFDELISSLRNGILLPIVTTVLTSLIIYLSKNLLLPILEQFLSLLNF